MKTIMDSKGRSSCYPRSSRRWRANLRLADGLLVAIFSILLLKAGVLAAQDATPASKFSALPTEQEFFHARVFEEPLVPVGGSPTLVENKALSRALREFEQRTDHEDVSAITDFLDTHPGSPWRGALLLNLGLEYYNAAYYSKALAAWEEAWQLSKDVTETKARALADRALGELMKMHARIGRYERLEELFQQTEGRNVSGSATEKIGGAQQGLWTMRHKPEIAFRCGPLALDRIRAFLNPQDVANPLIQNARSTLQGLSLAQVRDLSRQLKMDFQMARRKPGAQFITPAVVHWKVGHYAALVKEEGGRFLVEDPTFGNDVWVSPAALETETTGYFLAPPGALPAGWRAVDETEGQTVWGKGTTSNNNPDDTTPDDEKAKPDDNSCGMAVYNFHLMLVSLNISDTPVGYTPPVGLPANFTVTYNQREANQPANFSYSNLGQKWTFNWLAYIKDNPSVTNADVTYYVEGGGTETYTGFNTNTQTFATQWRNQTVLIRTSTNSYEMRLPDGSKKIFNQSDGSTGSSRKIFLKQIIDPAGNTNELSYDGSLRVVSLKDAIGQVTTLSYELTSGPGVDIYKITKVTDPFGRLATFEYDQFGQLSKITDVLGLTSQFTYGSGSFITSLTTPYGTTTFTTGSSGRTRWLEALDPQGDKERVEFNERTDIGIPNSEPGPTVPIGMSTRNNFMNARNSFFWDKKAMKDAPGDFSKARLYHWIHTADYQSANGTLESTKLPFENRVWFNYPGQIANAEGATLPGTADLPSRIGRVLDDGTAQLWQFNRNSLGRITNSIDPVGRTFTYVYDTNSIDLLEVRQTRGTNNELLARFTYNLQHLPLTAVDASGKTNRFSYNSRGQVVTNTNARSETTVFNYNTNGYLLSIDGPLSGTNDSTSFTYDGYGRIRTVTDSESYTVTTDYDAFDRPTTNSYPDGTYESITYNRLDPDTSRDRQGRTTHAVYNSLRQLIRVEEATNWVTRFEWCRCGDLKSLTDQLGRTTTWQHDVQGRVKSKQFVDGTRIQYAYETTTSRLKTITDEKGQTKNYLYFLDDNLQQVSYSNAVFATPTVSYTYDTNYDRLLTMQDGSGTNTYAYNPITATPTVGAGRLASVDGPLPSDTIAYTYDELGRVTNRAINSVSVSVRFDAMGRLTNVNNSLGAFTYAYTNATRRLFSIAYPNSQKTYFDYFDNSGDQRLKEIKHLTPAAATLSKFNYTYNPVGQITNWTQQTNAGTPQVYSLTYDQVDQLTDAVVTTNGTTQKTYNYVYDLAGNRLVEKIDSSTRSANFNPLNEIINQDAGSSPGFSGTKGYEWDAENRLVAITNGTQRTEFTYDGLNRRVRIVEKTNGIAGSDKRFVWCGDEVCEERDSTGGTVNKRFFGQGEQQSGTSYLFTRDHLSSVREMTDGAGAIQARYDFDPYGRRTKLSGSLEADFGFTGHYFHTVSKLHLAVYRAYETDTGRWVSRDPVGEAGGLNLYRYVFNSPANLIDPNGAAPQQLEFNFVKDLSARPNSPKKVPLPPPAPEMNAQNGGACALPGGQTSAAKTGIGFINPSDVRFTQDSIGALFKNGEAIDDVARSLRGPGGADLARSFEPIRLVERDGLLWTLDNRRLAAFSAGRQQVPFRMATQAEIAAEWARKFKTTADQGWGRFIEVRPPKGWTP